jgi:hypothetical protein
MLQVELKYKQLASNNLETCEKAVQYYGCTNQWGANILQLCPHTCRTGECQWRCGRDELPTEDGRQCWKLVERPVNPYTCARAISEGIDCHCKCANAYLQLARAGGGAFKAGFFLGDDAVALNKTAIANETFSISLGGQNMNTDRVNDAWGPRMKLVVKGQDCKYANLMTGLTGIQCMAPLAGSTSASTASSCITPPSKHSPYLHQWTDLKINQCGSFDVCHCNIQCDLTKNWHLAGSITLEPPVEVAGVAKALPGCQRAVPQMSVADLPRGEFGQKSITTSTFKVFGGLKEEHARYVQHAARKALVSVLKARSGLLKKDVPTEDDVTVQAATSSTRRLDEAWPFAEADLIDSFVPVVDERQRRLVDPGSCVDDDAAFKDEVAKLNMFFNTCAELLANLGDLNFLCSDAAMAAAVTVGCQKTCKLCPQFSTTTTTELVLVGDVRSGPTMSFDFAVTSYTDWSAANVLGRLQLLKNDPVPYLQRLFVELEYAFQDANVPAADLPSHLWVVVTAGPMQEVIPEEIIVEERKALTGSSIIFVALGGAIGGSCVLGCLFVMVWYCFTRGNKHRKVTPAVTVSPEVTVTKVSEGGYRLKKVKVKDEEVIEEQPDEPDCLEKVCAKLCSKCLGCYRRLCVKKLKKAKAFSQELPTPSTETELTIGSTVQLFGLTSAHYNGLTGTILSGPSEKGRYEVDLIVVNDHALEEHKFVSFKPDNMRVIPTVGDEENPSPGLPPGPVSGSYRSGGGGAGMGPTTFCP